MSNLKRYFRLRRLLRILRFGFAETWQVGLSPMEDGKPRLLLIKTEAIGDYVLFRNYLKWIRECSAYKDHEIVLVGNLIWKSLAEKFDYSYFDQAIFIDRKRFQEEAVYRKKLLAEISNRNYDLAVNCTFSREFLLGDSIIRSVRAETKIGMRGDEASEIPFVTPLTHSWYDRLSDAGMHVVHEFQKNRQFFTEITGREIPLNAPQFDISAKREKYYLLFPGAQDANRRWPPAKFGELCIRLYESYGLKPILSGSSSDAGLALEIINLLPSGLAENLCGVTPLENLPEILSKSSLAICNDSGTFHLAAATQTPAVCISNGNHFGRFIPYPEDCGLPLRFLFPSQLKADYPDFNQRTVAMRHGSDYTISSISVDEVFESVRELLNHEVHTAH